MMKSKTILLGMLLIISLFSVTPIFAQGTPDIINDILADMSRRVGQTVTLDDMDAWNWTDEIYSDAGLGCPQSGVSYAQTSTRGYAFFLTYENVLFDYRAPRGGTTFWLCNNPDLNSLSGSSSTTPTATPIPANNTQSSTTGNTSTSGNTAFPDSDYFPCPSALTGSVASRFQTGFTGRFVGEIALSVRAEPSRTSDSTGTIQNGTEFTVIDGPACDPTFTWWQVDTGSIVGWLPEVDPSDLGYWLEPLGGSSLPNVPLPAAGIPASRQAMSVSNAASITELARQTIDNPQNLLTGTSALNPEGIVVISTDDTLLVYSSPAPENPISTQERSINEMVIQPDESAGIIGIFTDQPTGDLGIGFFSTTNGGGGGGPLNLNFTSGMALFSNLNLLALGSENSVLLYDLESSQAAAELSMSATPSAIAASPTKSLLAVALPPDQVTLWDVSTRTQIVTLANQVSTLDGDGLAFSPNGQYLAVATTDGSVNIWNVETLQGFISLPVYGDGGVVFHLAYNPDGSLLATAGGPPPVEGDISDTFTLHIWDANTGDLLQAIPLEGFTEGLAFSEDGTLLHSIGQNNVWQVWGIPQ